MSKPQHVKGEWGRAPEKFMKRRRNVWVIFLYST